MPRIYELGAKAVIYDDGQDEAERSELRAQDRHDKKYQRELVAHPDCQDPDHPGCEACEGEGE